MGIDTAVKLAYKQFFADLPKDQNITRDQFLLASRDKNWLIYPIHARKFILTANLTRQDFKD